MKNVLRLGLFAFVLLYVIWTAKQCNDARGETYAPSDYVLLDLGTLSVGFDSIQTADSVRWVWGKRSGTTKIQYGHKLATSDSSNWITNTGHFSYEIPAAFGTDSSFNCWAEAKAYRFNSSGIKTWTWGTKPDPLEEFRQAKYIYVRSDGSDDSTGISWAKAVASLRIAESKCTGANEYFIYVAPGNYTSQCCTVNVANVKIVGAGWDRTILNGSTGKSIIMVDHTGRGFSVSGLSFVQDEAISSHGIYLDDVDGYVIDNCYFEKCYSSIETLGDADKGRISNCFAFASKMDGFKIRGEKVWVHHNVIDSLGDGAADGLYFLGSAAPLAGRNNVATQNYIRTTIGHPIRLSDDSSNYLIADNYAWAKNDSAYWIQQSAANLAFVGNHKVSEISNPQTAEEDVAEVLKLKIFQAADSGWYEILYPADGSANKDSVRVFNSSDACQATIIYHHSNKDAVIDSVSVKIW